MKSKANVSWSRLAKLHHVSCAVSDISTSIGQKSEGASEEVLSYHLLESVKDGSSQKAVTSR